MYEKSRKSFIARLAEISCVSYMKIGVCGIACEKCPRIKKGICPNGDAGCVPKQNKMCQIATCAFNRGVRWCFECADFPCENTEKGPINFGYCQYISGKAQS